MHLWCYTSICMHNGTGLDITLVILLSPGVSMEDGENWCSQINRLQLLLDKLECQVGTVPSVYFDVE